MLKLRVNEIFYSLQGEGARVGTANVFIRLSGCNKVCSFCDTKHKRGKLLTLEEIYHTIEFYKPCRNIIWTGGEPCLQLTDEVIHFFHYIYHQSIETNGSLPIPGAIDYITVSPKGYIHPSINKVDEVRIIYPNHFNQEAINYYHFKYNHLYLSPLFDGARANKQLISECINLVKENPTWRLSTQIQKIWKMQ